MDFFAENEPSGAASQDWFEEAAGGDTAAAERLLQYNEDDTYATLRVREWLRRGPEHWTVESAKFATPASRSLLVRSVRLPETKRPSSD